MAFMSATRPTYTALKATGFADPDRARQNLRVVLEGRPLTPYPAAARRALGAMLPVLLEALWQSPALDEMSGAPGSRAGARARGPCAHPPT
jgi:glutamine synthetase adenylyltransferase